MTPEGQTLEGLVSEAEKSQDEFRKVEASKVTVGTCTSRQKLTCQSGGEGGRQAGDDFMNSVGPWSVLPVSYLSTRTSMLLVIRGGEAVHMGDLFFSCSR